jgi:hypothetical protein
MLFTIMTLFMLFITILKFCASFYWDVILKSEQGLQIVLTNMIQVLYCIFKTKTLTQIIWRGYFTCVGIDCNVSLTLLMKEKKVKEIILEKSHIA